MTAKPTREEAARDALEQAMAAQFRRPFRRSQSVRVTVEDTDGGRDVQVEDSGPQRPTTTPGGS